jgi:serine/threonine protein kinase
MDVIDLLIQMCTYDPDSRITAFNALTHPYFDLVRYDSSTN